MIHGERVLSSTGASVHELPRCIHTPCRYETRRRRTYKPHNGTGEDSNTLGVLPCEQVHARHVLWKSCLSVQEDER